MNCLLQANSRLLSRPPSQSSTRFFSRGYSSLPSHLLKTPPTNVTTLQNGMRVATEETRGETATVGVWINAGSAYETKENNGVAHFLEHMAFKGTKNRTRQALEVEIENMGGTLNAYTSREQTVYYAKVIKNDVPKAIGILGDILLNSKLEEEHIEAERGTILREMEEVNKDPAEVIFDYLHAAAFQGTSLGRTILGPAENVKRLQRKDLQQYIHSLYTPNRFVLAAAGAVAHDQVVSATEKVFGQLPSNTQAPVDHPVNFTGSMATLRDDTLERTHVVVAVEGVGWSHPDYFTMMLMQTLVGSWDKSVGGGKNLSSKLCEQFATDDLADSVSSFNTCYNNTGLFGVYSVARPEHLYLVVRNILMEWGRLGQTVTAAEVDRAKGKLKAAVLMQLDGTTPIAEDLGRQLTSLGRRLTPAEIFLRIDAITPQDVMRVAREHCEDVCPAVAALGNTTELPDYNHIRNFTYWARL